MGPADFLHKRAVGGEGLDPRQQTPRVGHGDEFLAVLDLGLPQVPPVDPNVRIAWLDPAHPVDPIARLASGLDGRRPATPLYPALLDPAATIG